MKTAAIEDMRNFSGKVTSKVNPLLKDYANNLDQLQPDLISINDE